MSGDDLNDKKMLEEKYPSNSFNKPVDRGLSKVVTGRVIKKKKSIGEKFAATVYSPDTKNIVDYVIWDVLIPAAKATILEMINGALDLKFYGDSTRSGLRRERGKSYVSYNSFSSKDRGRPERRADRSKFVNRHAFDDVIMESRGDAELVLSSMIEMVDNYGVCTIAEFYDFAGLSAEWSDHKYGWDNLNSARITRVKDGYILELPKAETID